jgi:hypothetical protein
MKADDSLSDEQKSGVSKTDIPTGKDYIPEAISVLRDITNRLDALAVEQKSEDQKTSRFQRKSLCVQWCLFGATAAAFAAAAIYAHVASQQRDTMNATLAEIRKQTPAAIKSSEAATSAAKTASDSLEITQRAYLSIGEPRETLNGPVTWEVTIPVENYGHTRVSGFSIEMYFSRIRIKGMAKLEQRKLIVDQSSPIRPGPVGFAITVILPTEADADFAELTNGMQAWSIAGAITYDTGFGKKDAAIINICHLPQNGKWTNCGGMTTGIDFRKAGKTKQ